MTLTSSRVLPIWFGLAPRTPSKTSLQSGDQVRVGDPGAVEAVLRLARLVLPHLGHGLGVDLGVAPARDERGHAAHRVRPAPVAGLDQQLGVGAHERRGHRDRVPLGQHELAAPGAELLDHAEQVVPAARVQPGRVLPQLVEDLLHLERRRDRLDQHRGPDRAARDAERVLGQVERVVPQPRLEVALVLGQVEVGSLALVQLPLRAGRHVQRRSRPGCPRPARRRSGCAFRPGASRAGGPRSWPARRPGRSAYSLPSALAKSMVRSRASLRLSWPVIMLSHSGVLASSKSASQTLAPELSALIVIFLSVGPVISTRRSTSPGAGGATRQSGVLADVRRLGQEVEHRAAGELGLAAAARGQQLGPARAEFGVQGGDEVDGLRRKDLVVAITVGTGDLHAFGSRHVYAPPRSVLHPRRRRATRAVRTAARRAARPGRERPGVAGRYRRPQWSGGPR